MSLPKFFTIDEVAAITHAPRSSVFHWIYTDKLRSARVGKRRLVAETDLVAFMGIAIANGMASQLCESVKAGFEPYGKKVRPTKKHDAVRRRR